MAAIEAVAVGTELTGALLAGVNLSKQNLSGAMLAHADLSEANLVDADLAGADLSGANLRGSELSGADLTGANLAEAMLSSRKTWFWRGALSGAILTAANLSDAQLRGVDLSDAKLNDANLTRADLSPYYGRVTRLTGADMTGSILVGANLSGADLTQTDLTGANLTEANLRDATLVEANLTGANLTLGNLTRAKLTRATLTGAIVTDMKGATRVRAAAQVEPPGSPISGVAVKHATTTHFGVPVKPGKSGLTLTRDNYAKIDKQNSNSAIKRRAKELEILKYDVDFYLEHGRLRLEYFGMPVVSKSGRVEYKDWVEEYSEASNPLDVASRKRRIEEIEHQLSPFRWMYEDEAMSILTDEWCGWHREACLENFDLNMAFFSRLDPVKFDAAIDAFLRRAKGFRDVTNLPDYRDVPGYYLMVLDGYKQCYLGTADDIYRRIRQHWSATKKFDKLIFGSVETSRLSIDSFGPLDTTRIFAQSTRQTYELENKYISQIPDQYLLNRTAGGNTDLLGALAQRKTRELVE